MKNIGILILEFVITGLLLWIGLSGKKILFIDGARSAVLTLGVIGMFFCTISIGRFIQTAPMHPLTIVGYIFGVFALLIFVVQIFQWHVPLIYDPKIALYAMAICIAIKSLVGRFVEHI